MNCGADGTITHAARVRKALAAWLLPATGNGEP
jgi:hypothetical protein